MPRILVEDYEKLYSIIHYNRCMESMKITEESLSDPKMLPMAWARIEQANSVLEHLFSCMILDNQELALKLEFWLHLRMKAAKALLKQGWPHEAAAQQAVRDVTWNDLPPMPQEWKDKLEEIQPILATLERVMKARR